MKVILIRHAHAGSSVRWQEGGKPDHERPLTSKGAHRMKKVARRIHDIAPELSAVIASPFERCAASARILSSQFKSITPAFHNALEPEGDLNAILDALAMADAETIAVVGHEPNLSHLVTSLLLGSKTSRASPLVGPLKKGGFAVLEVDGVPGKEPARLKLLAEAKRR